MEVLVTFFSKLLYRCTPDADVRRLSFKGYDILALNELICFIRNVCVIKPSNSCPNGMSFFVNKYRYVNQLDSINGYDRFRSTVGTV